MSNLIIFSTLNWDEAGGAINQTQFARALARREHAVLFVEPQPSAQRDNEYPAIEIKALTELGMTPAQLRRAWFGLDSGDLTPVAHAIGTWLAAHPSREPGIA